MENFAQKLLWVAVPAAIGAAVTVMPGPKAEVQVIAYAILVLIAMAGIWATNMRARRREDERREQERWDALNRRLDLNDEANRTQLRNELVRMHREWVEEKGYITLEALEYAEKTYEVYHELGGNGSGTKLWEDIRALPIKR